MNAVFVFSLEAAKVIVSVQLPRGDVPAFLAPGGVFDAEWRVIVACREGRIYTVKVRMDLRVDPCDR